MGECTVKQGIKDTLVQADENSTILILKKVHNIGRFYKNSVTKKVAALEDEFPGDFKPLAGYMTGKRTYKSLHETGDAEDSAWTCGVAAGFITGIPTCREFMDNLV